MTPLLRIPLHLWFRLRRGLTLGVRAAAFDGDGRVLLVRHTYTPGWHLPGGGVEPGETAAEALGRELREEGAVEATAPPVLHGLFLNRAAGGRDHVLVFVLRNVRALGPHRPDAEIAEARFHPPGALPEGTTRATRARLAEIATGAPPAAEW